MGLRHRSIRLRVGLLISVPVLCLLALYGFVASITLGSAITQQHARLLKNDLAEPVSAFQLEVAQERALALQSLANPTNTQVASALGVQESKTQQALGTLTRALHAPRVMSYAAGPEQAAINNMLSLASMSNLSAIRGRVADDAISMRGALAEYDAVINSGYQVIDEAIDQQTNVPFVTQALDVVNLDRAASATQEEWDLLTADMAQRKFPDADRLAFAAIVSQRQALINNTVPEMSPQYSAIVASNVTPAVAAAMTAAESSVIDTPWRHGVPPAQVAAASKTFLGYYGALGKTLTETGDALQNQANHDADIVLLQLILAAGLGLIGTILSVALSLMIGRGLIRQLRELRESALTLAHEKLPDVITRLRSGEPVDMADYAPDAVASSNEIEQVQNAFEIVQETAVQSAVDEARLRRGISDVFRNLAGRSQSLLHRQLTLLDGMERRATEPDELEDLFRIDHLTTRMRRHAEGLIILSGEAPARGWRQPVPLVDVLRAAVAEVEDYTRIRVLCRTSAAVAGHAVADVIHLIAELAENATVFSPPNTPVRIQGDVVGRGFAIEIEDRGLGISAARLEEINANLANPPQFDLSGSDRLGLFIAGQLAQRHEIKITLRPSVYGGTTAIVLIPTALVVDGDTFQRDPALAAAGEEGVLLPDAVSGRHAALAQAGGPPTNALAAGSFGSNVIEAGSSEGNGFGSGGFGSNGYGTSAYGASGPGSNAYGASESGSNGLGTAGFGTGGFGTSGFGTNGFAGSGAGDRTPEGDRPEASGAGTTNGFAGTGGFAGTSYGDGGTGGGSGSPGSGGASAAGGGAGEPSTAAPGSGGSTSGSPGSGWGFGGRGFGRNRRASAGSGPDSAGQAGPAPTGPGQTSPAQTSPGETPPTQSTPGSGGLTGIGAGGPVPGGSAPGATGAGGSGSGPRTRLSGDGLLLPEPQEGADYLGRGFSLGGRSAFPPAGRAPSGSSGGYPPADSFPNADSYPSSTPFPADPPAAGSYEAASRRPVTDDPAVPGSAGSPSMGASPTGGALPRRAVSPDDAGSTGNPDTTGSDSKVSPADVASLGLPVRVRQASLAPQLRSTPPRPAASEPGFGSSGFGSSGFGSSGFGTQGGARPGYGGPASGPAAASPGADAPPSSAPTGAAPASPEAARNTVSALQRGWQLGRSAAESGPQESVFPPRRSPSGQPFGPDETDPGSTGPERADSAEDQRDGE